MNIVVGAILQCIVSFENGAAQCVPASIQAGTHAGNSLGICVAPAGDVDGDGVTDILLSEPGYNGTPGFDSGRVRVRSGATNTTIRTWSGPSHNQRLATRSTATGI